MWTSSSKPIVLSLLLLLVGSANAVCVSSDDCLHGGTCDPNTKQCICAAGSWGESCEQFCPLQCKNKGQCELAYVDLQGGLEVEGEYICRCPVDENGHANYTGTLCEMEAPPAHEELDTTQLLNSLPCPLQCKNGGQCKVTLGDHGREAMVEAEYTYHCECPTEEDGGVKFTGNLCATRVGEEEEASPQSGSDEPASQRGKLASILLSAILSSIAVALLISYVPRYRQRFTDITDVEPQAAQEAELV